MTVVTKGGLAWCHGGGGLGGHFFRVCFLIHMRATVSVARCILVFIRLHSIPKKNSEEMCKLSEYGEMGQKMMIIFRQSVAWNENSHMQMGWQNIEQHLTQLSYWFPSHEF